MDRRAKSIILGKELPTQPLPNREINLYDITVGDYYKLKAFFTDTQPSSSDTNNTPNPNVDITTLSINNANTSAVNKYVPPGDIHRLMSNVKKILIQRLRKSI